MNIQEYLVSFRARHGPFRLSRRDKQGWDFNGVHYDTTKWRPYDDVKGSRYETEANLRELTNDEVVLDIDKPSYDEALAAAKLITTDLEMQGIRFTAWFTGSKGIHIHIFFSDLATMTDDKRKRARKVIITKYTCDLAKQAGMVAIEHVPHFKTGRPKTVIANTNTDDVGNQCLPSWVTEQLKRTRPQRSIKTNNVIGDVRQHALIQAILHTPSIDNDGFHARHKTIMKNLAILFIQYNTPDNERFIIEEELCSHMPGKKPSEIEGWIAWFKNKNVVTA